MNIAVRTEPVFGNFDFSAFLTHFELNLARLSEFGLKYPPKMAATCLKIKIFKKGLCTHLDITNICHFLARFPIQMPENACLGANFDVSVLGGRLIFFDSVERSRSPIIQIQT